MMVQGNTQGKRNSLDEPVSREAMPVGSPNSPGSPLTYVPQTQMEPPLRPSTPDHFALSGRQQGADFHALAGWPAQPKLVPTVIICETLIIATAYCGVAIRGKLDPALEAI